VTRPKNTEPDSSKKSYWFQVFLAFLTIILTSIGAGVVAHFQASREYKNWEVQYQKTKSDNTQKEKINLLQQFMATNYEIGYQTTLYKRLLAEVLCLAMDVKKIPVSTQPSDYQQHLRDKLKQQMLKYEENFLEIHKQEVMLLKILIESLAIFESPEIKQASEDICGSLCSDSNTIVIYDPNAKLEKELALMQTNTLEEASKIIEEQNIVSMNEKYLQNINFLTREMLKEILERTNSNKGDGMGNK